MFSKSKRFDDKPVGCGADAVYDPKVAVKPIGGVIPKVDRFVDSKNVCSQSDADSVHSDKSSQVFRTPKAVRRMPGTPVHKKMAIKTESKELFEELLAAKSVELRNKDETIKEYEIQIKDMKDCIFRLEAELAQLKSKHEKESNVWKQELDSNKNVIALVEAQMEELEGKLTEKQAALTQLNILKAENEAKLSILSEESKIFEAFLTEMNISDEINSLSDKIASVKSMYEDKSKMIHLLEKNKQKLEKQNAKLNNELATAKDEFSSQMKILEEDFANQLKHLNENATEKMRICEIQFEERYNDLQSYSEYQLNQEIKNRHEGLQICQEMAEKEILKSELQIDDLKHALQINEVKINQLSNIIDGLQDDIAEKNVLIEQLQTNIATSENHIISQKTSYENQIASFKAEIEKVTKEKSNFSRSVDIHLATLDVISARLRNSDKDVENFKSKLESALALNNMYETEIVELQIEFSSFQDEYKQLLTSIVNSKAALDKEHQEIISSNAKTMDLLEAMKIELVENVETVKTELLKDLEQFKKQAEGEVSALHDLVKKEQKLRSEFKIQCDEAFSKLSVCQSLLSLAELQLESKDQELIETGAENDRLSGTLAATIQEKSELETLLEGFVKLTKDKDSKISGLLKQIESYEDDLFNSENRIKELNEFLEATDYIVKEKDLEINNLNEVINKLNNVSLNEECQELKSNNDKKADELEKLRKELTEITDKYTELLGHHNSKQKIKHVTSLKLQNVTLKEENSKLIDTVNRQALTIEKLKKELECANVVKSPLFQKKQILHMSSPHGKENRASPVFQSPNRPETPSSRPLTPLRDSNR